MRKTISLVLQTISPDLQTISLALQTISPVPQTGAKLPACSTLLRSRSFLFCARKPSLQENMRRRLHSLFSGPENRILPALKRILRAQASFFPV